MIFLVKKVYVEYLLLGVGIHKRTNEITLQKDFESVLVIFHYFIWKHFWMKSFATCYLKYI
jgi:hypothetical protein